MDMTTAIQALRDRARRMVSLDTPQDADLGDVALDIGAGFVPGVGSALSARDVVRGYREGDPIGMALGAAGMIPVVGGAASAINKVRRGDAIADALRAKYPDVKLDLSGDDKLYLGKIVVPKDKRSQGIGSSVMSDLIKQADEAGVPVSLSPSSDFGGSVGRLKEFYKRFGFVENKGRNKDFSISDSMYRQPVAPVADVGATVSALRAPRDEALETARKNAVKMLGLPENNTAMDRARAMGYVDDVKGGVYRGSHQAPTSADEIAAPAHQLNRTYPDDVYSSRAAQYYGHGSDRMEDASVVRRLQALRDNPDAPVVIFRAVPKSAPGNPNAGGINHGDWVTPSKAYAVEHGEGPLRGDYKILRDRVPAKTLFTDGNSIYEFGYDKSQKFAAGPASIPIMRSSNPANRERSRFAAFDPAKVGDPDLLGRADPRLLAVMAGGGLTGLTVNALRNKRNEEKEKSKEKETQ